MINDDTGLCHCISSSIFGSWNFQIVSLPHSESDSSANFLRRQEIILILNLFSKLTRYYQNFIKETVNLSCIWDTSFLSQKPLQIGLVKKYNYKSFVT